MIDQYLYFYQGCYEQGRNWLWDHSAPIIGVGFGISVLIVSTLYPFVT